MAAAAQQAPADKAPRKKNQTAPEKAGIGTKVSRPVGIGIMAVLLCLALVIGNGRALSKATPKAFLSQGEVASILEDRVKYAKNAETVARRAGIDESYFTAVEETAKQLQDARSARAVSRADQELSGAVGDMTGAAVDGLDANDAALLTGAMDTFNDAGNLLRFEARAFNEKAEKAEKVYDGLLLKGLFSRPDVYEGI